MRHAATDATDLRALDTDAVARAVAEPRRRQILSLTRDAELSAGEIAAGFEISRPAVSQHIAVLRRAGLLAERREGPAASTGPGPRHLGGLRDFIEGFWADRLERLKLAAELEQQRRNKSARHRNDRGRRDGDQGRSKP